MFKTKLWVTLTLTLLPIFFILAGYFTRTTFFIFLTIYGLVVLLNLVFQILYSHINNKRTFPNNPDYLPKVSVIVPTYKEDHKSLFNSVYSLATQKYPDYEIILVDDGTPNDYSELVYKNIKNSFPDLDITYHKFEKNKGKRHAQYYGFNIAKGEIIVTIDSDTIIDKNGLFRITRPFYFDDIGAATGNCSVLNYGKNLLTRLIRVRYWSAFNQERSSQGLFGCVMCVSGVFGAYRKDIVDKLKNRYIKQRFMGHECTFGDDRHLSNLFLAEGYKIVYIKDAWAWTIVPETIKKYLKQQLRWNKSFYREIFWNLKSIHKQHPYMSLELFLQAVLPFFLFVNLTVGIYTGFTTSFFYFLFYLLMIFIMGELRSIYGALNTGWNDFLLFPLYSFLHIFLLIPVRFLALVSLPFNGWGTR